MTAHSDREAREEMRRVELARLRSEVTHCEAWHANVSARAQAMRKGGFRTSAEALEARARQAYEELLRARKALKRAERGTT